TMRNFAEGDISSIQPIEAAELGTPLRIERMQLRTDSGGCGWRRGGLGLQREIRVLAPEAQLSVLSDKNIIPPYGVRGGGTGARKPFPPRRDAPQSEAVPLPA